MIESGPRTNVKDDPRSAPEARGLVSAVVLTYNKWQYTRLCIEGMCRTAYRPLEIILIDNGSSGDPTSIIHELEEKASAAGVGFTCIVNDSNKGAPGARNQAIAAACGELVLFVDNDVVPFNSGWLGTLVEQMRTLPDAGGVSARLLYPFEPHLVQFAGCGISRSGRVQYIGRGASREDPEFTAPRKVQCLISACLLMPIRAVRAVGQFDETYHPVQYEDLDLCYRLKEQGFCFYVVPAAEVYHFENTTTDGCEDINFRYVTIKNGLLFKNRWRHRFELEDGPDDAGLQWKHIPHQTLEQMGADWNPWTATR